MPAANHNFYLSEFYGKNALAEGKMMLDGVSLDLSKVKLPVYELAAREDHIAPAASVFRGSRLLGGPVKFVLAGSGHIAGVVNHPNKKKYHYSTNSELPDTVEQWMENAERHDYSWWPYWMKWLKRQSKGTVPARIPGDGKLDVIEDAPGSYVKVKAE